MFKDTLKKQISMGSIAASDLAARAGISVSTLSRYTNGSRTPEAGSGIVEKLADGIFQLGEDAFISLGSSREDILSDLTASLENDQQSFDYETLSRNLRTLISELGISTGQIASEVYISNSTMSRILAGNYKPRDPDNIVDNVCRYLRDNYTEEDDKALFYSMLNREAGIDPETIQDLYSTVGDWLCGKYESDKTESSLELLSSLSQFDLGEYLKAMNVENVHIPTTRWKLPTTKVFTGQKGLEDGILAFLKTTATSSSPGEVFIYSDHPLEHLTRDHDTLKLWMKGLGATLLQGKKVTVIHNTDRPTSELMLGFEAWIPLYMTGQVQSYYSENPSDNLFHHILLVSGSAVFSGYTVKGSEDHSNLTFSKSMAKIKEGRIMADQLLESCRPLISVYDSGRSEEYTSFLSDEDQIPGPRIYYPGALPAATMSDETLKRVLGRSDLDDDTRMRIIKYVDEERERYETILKHSTIREFIEAVPESELKGSKIPLDLSKCIPDRQLFYEPSEFMAHLDSTKAFAEANENYTITEREASAFKNISISVRKDGVAVISRIRGAELHFVIQQPRLVQALYDLKIPVWDK